MRNCDVDDCLNPKCPTHTALTYNEVVVRLEEAGLDRRDLRNVRKYNSYLYNREDVEELCK
jgi:hypothetical protein